MPFGFSPLGDDSNDMANMFEQLGRAMRMTSNSDSAVNWDAALTASRQAIAKSGDPGASTSQTDAVRAAEQLANVWLDSATIFPATNEALQVISRSQWLESTFPTWKTIVEPVAQSFSKAMSAMMPSPQDIQEFTLEPQQLDELPEDIRNALTQLMGTQDFGAILGQMGNMARTLSASMFGTQCGETLGEMSLKIHSMTDVGIKLTTAQKSGIVMANVEQFGADLEVSPVDVTLYIVLRELAHQRLFLNAPWLESQILNAIETYARGVHIDQERIQELVSNIDPEKLNLDNFGEIQNTIGADIFEALITPEQQSALEKLELLLALIEGWVTVVVRSAVDGRLTSVTALEETFRRRRAAGGPAERFFSGLVGLDLRPRRLREATALWEMFSLHGDSAKRDEVWSHPDLLPTLEHLDHPSSYFESESDGLMDEVTKFLKDQQ